MKGRKAQSAMEYLMTYGWAILIIAIVLAALFSLGVFSSSSFLGTTCISLSGYTCSSPLLHSGEFTATVGQATGTSWTAVNMIFLESTAGSVTSSMFTTNCMDSVGSLSSGATVTFAVYNGVTSSSTPYCSSLPNSVGGTASGSIWASYTAGGTSGLMAQLATVTLKAT